MAPRGEILHVEIVLPDVRHPAAVGRELGEHERRGLGLAAAELPERAARAVEHPVVTAGVEPPDRLRVGEDQQLPAVGRPGVVLDRRAGRRRLWASARAPVTMTSRRPLSTSYRTMSCALPVGGGLERGVGRAVAQPAGGPEWLGGELGGAVDPGQREQARIGLLGRRAAGHEQRRGPRASRQGGDESRVIPRVVGCDAGGPGLSLHFSIPGPPGWSTCHTSVGKAGLVSAWTIMALTREAGMTFRHSAVTSPVWY